MNSWVLCKAMGMVLIVTNHALTETGLHGGLNLLLVASGYYLAKFNFESDTSTTVSAISRSCKRMLYPAWLLSFAWCALTLLVGSEGVSIDMVVHELGLYSNWLYRSRVSLHPVWYVQAFVQMSLFTMFLFWAFKLNAPIKASPHRTTLAILILSVCGMLAFHQPWMTERLGDKLPISIFWCYSLGWYLWALEGEDQNAGSRALASTIVLICCWAIFIHLGTAQGESRMAIVTPCLLAVIWVKEVRLPSLITHWGNLVSSASLAIFLLHYYVFWALGKVSAATAIPSSLTSHPITLVSLGIVIPTVIWAFTKEMEKEFFARGLRGGTSGRKE